MDGMIRKQGHGSLANCLWRKTSPTRKEAAVSKGIPTMANLAFSLADGSRMKVPVVQNSGFISGDNGYCILTPPFIGCNLYIARSVPIEVLVNSQQYLGEFMNQRIIYARMNSFSKI